MREEFYVEAIEFLARFLPPDIFLTDTVKLRVADIKGTLKERARDAKTTARASTGELFTSGILRLHKEPKAKARKQKRK